jgi:hypothetical protein
MRSLLIVGVLCVLTSGSQTPLVSVSKLSELVSDSVSLTVDLTKFTSVKLEESLSGQPKHIYAQFTNKAVTYKKMVKDTYAASPVSGVVQKAAGAVWTVATEQYTRINALSGKIIDPLVNEFETRFPASKGLVGPSVADRLLVLFWLVWCIRRAARLVLAVFTSAPRRYKA